jgi:hypothetical protein
MARLGIGGFGMQLARSLGCRLVPRFTFRLNADRKTR